MLSLSEPESVSTFSGSGWPDDEGTARFFQAVTLSNLRCDIVRDKVGVFDEELEVFIRVSTLSQSSLECLMDFFEVGPSALTCSGKTPISENSPSLPSAFVQYSRFCAGCRWPPENAQ